MAIITVTLNPALDIWATTAVLEPDRKLHCTDTELTPGGGGLVDVAPLAGSGGDRASDAGRSVPATADVRP